MATKKTELATYIRNFKLERKGENPNNYRTFVSYTYNSLTAHLTH